MDPDLSNSELTDLGSGVSPEIFLYPHSKHMIHPALVKEARDKGYIRNQVPPDSPAGCAVMLAHEIGHALGASDNPPAGNKRVEQ